MLQNTTTFSQIQKTKKVANCKFFPQKENGEAAK